MDDPPDADFCKHLAKVELHAHLTGSISRQCLQEIWDTRRQADPTFAQSVPEPRVALGEGTGQNISEFFGHFNKYLYHLVSTPDTLSYATQRVLQDFNDDGVVYLELRTTPRPLPPYLNAEETIDLILGVIEEWNNGNSSPSSSSPASTLGATASTSRRMTVRLILTVDRAKHSAQQANDIVDLALRLHAAGRPVVGVDLAGDPSVPSDLTRFREPFERARKGGLGLTVHFAELPRDDLREEMEEMLSWRPNRLGHAIHVPPDLRQRIVDEGIAVELCLTCNVLAGMLPPPSDDEEETQGEGGVAGSESTEKGAGYTDHHFGWWWHHTTTPVSLGTDDVGVFLSNSSDEHALAARHFGLTRSDLIALTKRAAGGAFDKDTAMAAIDMHS